MNANNNNNRAGRDGKAGKSKSLVINQGNLSLLNNLMLDPNINRLLTSLSGEIVVSIRGRTSVASVIVGKHNVTLEEFSRVLAATSKVTTLVRQARGKAAVGGIQQFVSRIAHALGIDPNDFVAVDNTLFGLMKASIATFEKVESNGTVIEEIISLHPGDALGPVLRGYVKLTKLVVARGLAALMVGESVSEKNSENIRRFQLPHDIFHRFTNDKIQANASPYVFLFSRKRGKGVKVTTEEIRDPDFRSANATLLSASKVLVNLISNDKFLEETIGTDGIVTDDVKQQMFLKHKWHVFSPVETDGVGFFELKNKNTVEIITDCTTVDLKKRLAKLDNALLRASQMESAGPRPDLLICNVLFPSGTDFNPAHGVKIFDAMAAEETVNAKVTEYKGATTELAANLWSDIFCSEIRLNSSDAMRRFFCVAAGVMPAVDEELAHIEIEEGEPINEITVFGRNWEEVDSSFTHDAGDDRIEEIVALNRALFTLNITVGDSQARSRNIVPLIALTKPARQLVRLIRDRFGDKAATGLTAYLCSFSLRALQNEALRLIRSAMDHNRRVLFAVEEPDAVPAEELDTDRDNDDQDENSVDSIEFNEGGDGDY